MTERRTDESGAAFAGSQLQTQLHVNRRTAALDDAIRVNFPELRAARLEWRSPIATDGYAEYWDRSFLKHVDLEHHAADLSAFWPTGGPHWDALAVVHRQDDTRPGVVLGEGKSYPAELFGSGTGAKPGSRSHSLIVESLGWTQPQLGVRGRTGEDWCGRLYQSANRLAHLCWLRSLGVRAWLVHLLFTDDRHGPTGAAEWHRAYAEANVELGLADKSVPGAAHILLPAGTRADPVGP
jgi:hypothetical protein